MLIAERLRELFSYNPESGIFTRLVSTSSNARAGDIAGWANSKGYMFIRIDGHKYKAHRLAWLYVHGEWPNGDLDHIDGHRDHNWIGNLRPATRSQNIANMRNTNISGFKGATRRRDCRRWSAQITVNGRKRHLGLFNTPEAAHAAYVAAAKEAD